MRKTNLSPTVDLVFRKLFGSEENKDLLISLINSVVEPRIHISDLVIKNPFNLAAYKGAKESIVDIKAVDQDGTWYDIEMQMMGHIFYGKRALYYVSKGYVDQLESGEQYAALNTSIGIHFMGYDVFDDDRVSRHFVFKDSQTHDEAEQLQYMQLYFVELSKFHKDWPEVRTLLDRWIAFLTLAEELSRNNLPPAFAGQPTFEKAVAQLERMSSDSELRAIYEAEEKARMATVAEIQYAEDKGRREMAAKMTAEIQYAEDKGRREMAAKMAAQIESAEQHGQARLLLRLMSRRIGDVPAALASRIQTLTESQLEALGDAVFDLRSHNDVEAWLSEQGI